MAVAEAGAAATRWDVGGTGVGLSSSRPAIPALGLAVTRSATGSGVRTEAEMVYPRIQPGRWLRQTQSVSDRLWCRRGLAHGTRAVLTAAGQRVLIGRGSQPLQHGPTWT